ncbi:hypothetical protein [Thermaurantiacus sp.]
MRWLLVFFLLLAGAVVAGLLLKPAEKAPPIVRVEMAIGREQLILERRRDTGAWVIASANDAPGDAERIDQLVKSVLALKEGAAAAARPADEPMQIRLTSAAGRVVRHIALWPQVARTLPDGRPFLTDFAPPELSPSAWSTLAPPPLNLADLQSAEAIGPGGPTPLPPAKRAALRADLEGLGARGWVLARTLDWTAATYVQARRADGAVIEIQHLTLADGRRFVRLTSDRDPALRSVRFFAFRLPDSPAGTKVARGAVPAFVHRPEAEAGPVRAAGT